MRKFIGLAVVIAFLWVSAAPVEAVSLVEGDLKAKFDDYSSFYSPGGVAGLPQPVGVPAVGDELRAIFRVTSIITDDVASIIIFNATPDELTGTFYDLVVPAGGVLPGGSPGVPVGTTVVDLVPGLRITQPASPAPAAGGWMDIYNDASPDFDLTGGGPGPNAWVAAAGPGGADSFPTVTDGNTWLRGMFVPLVTIPGAGIPGITAPFTAGAVYRLSFTALTGVGNGVGYVNVLVNNTGLPFLPNRWGPFAEIEVKSRLDFPPSQTPPGGWAVQSEDPVRFTALPEPATMSLLLVGLVGGAGAYLRRRRAA